MVFTISIIGFLKVVTFAKKINSFPFFLFWKGNAKARIRLWIRALFAADYECAINGGYFVQTFLKKFCGGLVLAVFLACRDAVRG